MADFVIGTREELEGVFWNARFPEAFDHFPASLNDLGCGFHDNGITSGKSCEDAATGDGAGKVPRGGNEDGAEWGGMAAIKKGWI